MDVDSDMPTHALMNSHSPQVSSSVKGALESRAVSTPVPVVATSNSDRPGGRPLPEKQGTSVAVQLAIHEAGSGLSPGQKQTKKNQKRHLRKLKREEAARARMKARHPPSTILNPHASAPPASTSTGSTSCIHTGHHQTPNSSSSAGTIPPFLSPFPIPPVSRLYFIHRLHI